MGKLNEYLLGEALKRVGCGVEEWHKFIQLVRFRREAHATALVLGWTERFYDIESMKAFFLMDTIASGRSSWHGRTKQEMMKMFRAWKPFVKGSGITNAEDFYRLWDLGHSVIREIRLKRGNYRVPYDFRLHVMTVGYTTSIKQESTIEVSIMMANIERLRMNRALAVWLPHMLVKNFKNGMLLSGTKWNRPSIQFTIEYGKIDTKVENYTEERS